METSLKKYSYFLPFVVFLIIGIFLESFIAILSSLFAVGDFIFGGKIDWFYFIICFSDYPGPIRPRL